MYKVLCFGHNSAQKLKVEELHVHSLICSPRITIIYFVTLIFFCKTLHIIYLFTPLSYLYTWQSIYTVGALIMRPSNSVSKF